jgi:hypothetical protein
MSLTASGDVNAIRVKLADNADNSDPARVVLEAALARS